MTSIKTGKVSFLSKLSLVWNRLMPSWAEKKISSQLFWHNTKKPRDINLPKRFKQRTLKTPEGKINAYQVGKGPMVIFIHGWGGGAYQFFPLMRGLNECGFSALAFDHLGHERSENKQASLQQLISTSNFIIQSIKKNHPEGIASVVGHDVGSLIICNARPTLIEGLPIFLIAPIFNYKLFFLRKLGQLNLHPDILKKYAARFIAEYPKQYAALELSRRLEKYSDVTVIAHDENDDESPVADSVRFCKRFPMTKLITPKGWGHSRIINSESVWQELKSHLNYEDTTINYSNIILKDINNNP